MNHGKGLARSSSKAHNIRAGALLYTHYDTKTAGKNNHGNHAFYSIIIVAVMPSPHGHRRLVLVFGDIDKKLSHLSRSATCFGVNIYMRY